MIAIGVPFSIPGLFGDFVFRLLDHHTFICTKCHLLELMSCPLNKIDRCKTNSNSLCVEQRKTAQTNPSINQTNNQTNNFFIKFPHWSKSMTQKYRVGQLKKFPPPFSVTKGKYIQTIWVTTAGEGYLPSPVSPVSLPQSNGTVSEISTQHVRCSAFSKDALQYYSWPWESTLRPSF